MKHLRTGSLTLIPYFYSSKKFETIAQCHLSGCILSLKGVNRIEMISNLEVILADLFKMIDNLEGFFADHFEMIGNPEGFFVDHFEMIGNPEEIFADHLKVISIKLAPIIAYGVALWFTFEIRSRGDQWTGNSQKLYIH